MNRVEAAWTAGDEGMLPFSPRADADAVVDLIRSDLPNIHARDLPRIRQWCRFVVGLATMDRERPPDSVVQLMDELFPA